MNNDKPDMYGMDEVEYYLAMEKAQYLESLIAPPESDKPTDTKSQQAEEKSHATGGHKA